MSSLEKLIQLYGSMSKHSNYQVLPTKLRELTGSESFETLSRWERERFDYIAARVPLQGMRVLDIGGNSGYFTFEALEAGAKQVLYFEGNAAHSEFVSLAAQLLELDEKVEVHNRYYDFEGELHDGVCVGMLLNVLHHVGDDYGDKDLGLAEAKTLIAEHLNTMAAKVDYLALQIGFCWKGDRDSLLFPGGTKRELIDFVREAASSVWEVLDVGIPEKSGGTVNYKPTTDDNLRRDDVLGEFLNRPIFILRSLTVSN